MHDACVFSLSLLYKLGSAGTLLPNWTKTFDGVDVSLVLLGDSAYPLLSWLMKGRKRSNTTAAKLQPPPKSNLYDS